MKRGKDDDKIMDPMFPRLHVNDADKGGPRAPPRNKMALYEQFSIPTQRFSHAACPLSSNNGNLVTPGFSSQGSGRERNMLFPPPVQPSTPTHQAEKLHGCQPAGATLNTRLAQLEEKKKIGNDDDFAVPVFAHPEIDQCHSKTQSGIHRGKISPVSPTYPGHLTNLQNIFDKDAKRSSSLVSNPRHETRHRGEENPNICTSISNHSVKSFANESARDRVDGFAKVASALPSQEYVDLPGSDLSRLNSSNALLQHESRAGLQQNDRGHCDDDESGRDAEKEIVPQTRSGAHTREEHGSPNEPVIDNDYNGTNTCGSPQFRNGDKSDDVSDTSMVDGISGLDITPDDVVGIIGQKDFWKARKAIVNQQRVFAVQVFELHRLIKVQQLIAGSPHILLEDSAYLGKPSLNASPAKKLLPEYVVKPLPHVKCRDDSEKPNHKMECSAENAVGKTSLSSVKNVSQPSNYGPYLANPPSALMAADSRMGPWCFHHSPVHQWLIPVMSPSEGLIYKPCPGHGFMGAVCGTGCGPFGSTPLSGNFMNPALGMPSLHPHQGIGAIPGAHPVGHSYFPPYGMPIMNPSISGSATEQKNQFAGPGPHGQLSGGGANFNMQHKSSSNVPAQKSGAIPQVMQFQASKDTELQGSTASSPGERIQSEGTGPAVEGRDSLPLFNKAPVIQEGVPQPATTLSTLSFFRIMASSNIRDILTSFSPSLDYFAICAGDARIKIWDTLKGQVQTEFADIASTEMSSLYANKPERGHLSVDYTCMKWLALDRKKKRKLGSSLLVLGTGSGSVLALDVAAGQLKWRISDCHPGGVSAVSFAAHGSCIYSAGADGMICEIDSLTGNLLEKFRASTKGISCMAVSPDGKMLATAAGQLKTFNCSDHKKTQKFSGHPGAVRFMMFSEDGKYILSSAVGERYIALWRTDGGKKQSASCVLSMEHPAVFIDGKCIDSGEVDDAGLYVLAISETGVCYFWYGHNIDELRNTKATKISISSEDILSQNQKGAFPAIFAAKLQGIAKPASAHAFVAHGLLVKPSFQKIVVHSGTDLSLHSSQDGVLLPMSQSVIKSKKGLDVRNRVTALDRAYAEDAVLPLPKILDVHEKKNRHQTLITDPGEVMADSLDSKSQPKFVESKGDTVEMETESEIICMEDRLRSLGILSGKDDPRLNLALKSTLFNGIDLESNIPEKKMRVAVLSMSPTNACELLEVLVNMWQSRSDRGKHILQWIYSILVNHSHHVLSQKSLNPMINSLYKITKSREASFQPLLQLSGRLQLIMAQIDKATGDKTQILAHDDRIDESEDEDEDVEELLYGELDNESQISRSSDEDD